MSPPSLPAEGGPGGPDPEAARGGPLLVFDSDCSLCRGSVRLLVRLGWLDQASAVGIAALPRAERERLLEAGFANALAVLAPDGGISLGLPALARIVSLRAPRVARLLQVRALAPLLRALYTLVASHRRILAPPRGPECACEPSMAGWVPLAVQHLLVLTIIALLWPAPALTRVATLLVVGYLAWGPRKGDLGRQREHAAHVLLAGVLAAAVHRLMTLGGAVEPLPSFLLAMILVSRLRAVRARLLGPLGPSA
ncbi:MAG: DUF393 domain-containing protein [Planctomycetes bacterium]|nr:DUF393 domain-containing protein [Planctomycetota bacterium]MDA0948639.1 DCC1-like thiol-disulfide oxidoreductase family protein [Planctomycetota bacterium]